MACCAFLLPKQKGRQLFALALVGHGIVRPKGSAECAVGIRQAKNVIEKNGGTPWTAKTPFCVVGGGLYTSRGEGGIYFCRFLLLFCRIKNLVEKKQKL